jgi:PadR family transcriptional regulator PadR
VTKGRAAAPSKLEVLQGTLDLMVQILASMGPLHGYGISRRLERMSEDLLTLNEGTMYASLMRLQQKAWITATWGTSENNRKAKFYTITKAGRRQLAAETESWERIASLMACATRRGASVIVERLRSIVCESALRLGASPVGS